MYNLNNQVMNIIKRKFKNLIKWSLMNIKPINRMFSDETYLKILYRLYSGHKLDLENPRGFSEKLQWLKLYGFRPIYTTLVDKYAVKQYISDMIGPEYNIPLIGVYNHFEDIDFDVLPNQFVMKCNHDSGSKIIVTDKSKLDIRKARKKLNKRLKMNYYYLGRDSQYRYIQPKIIIEQYMTDNTPENQDFLCDYKFFCFNGEPKIMYIANDGSPHANTDHFDMDFNHLPFYMHDLPAEVTPSKPEKFEEMKALAKKLCADYPFVRIDFYFINHNIYFGEFTIIHNGGLYRMKPEEWEIRLGDWIKLPEKNPK